MDIMMFRMPREKTAYKFARLVLLTVFALCVGSHPVYAQSDAISTHDPMAALASNLDAIGKEIQSLIQTHIADSAAANARTNTNVGTTQKIAIDHAAPPPGSCGAAASSGSTGAGGAKASTAAVGGAMVQAGSKRPDDPATTATEIKAQIDDGLVPCTPPPGALAKHQGNSTADPDSSAYYTMQCTRKWDGKYEDADLSMDVLFGSYSSEPGNSLYGLAVPPQFQNLQNGAYQPVPTVTSEKYMPFVAAYSFCQRINPRRMLAPQGVSGKPTVALLNVAAKNDADAKMTTAYSMCMHLLAERMQYGSEDSAFADQHNAQVNQCTANKEANWLDDTQTTISGGSGSFTDCSTYGRSELQARHDIGYMDSYEIWHTTFLQPVDTNFRPLLQLQAVLGHAGFDGQVDKERADLSAAIAAANETQGVYTNPALTQPNQ